MIPWELIDSAPLPGSAEQISLHKRGAEFSIRVQSREVMNSRMHESEDALADIICPRLADRPSPSILIGGLGMGFTLRAALRQLGPKAQVVVAELVPAVVRWNQELIGHLAGHPLRDKRTALRQMDVAEVILAQPQRYDAILQDVDNGPEGLTREQNGWLYRTPGLEAACAALRPRGVLAVWSAGPNRIFTQRLRAAGFKVEEVRPHARNVRRHTIWVAERRA
jgi:spermidine synthase